MCVILIVNDCLTLNLKKKNHFFVSLFRFCNIFFLFYLRDRLLAEPPERFDVALPLRDREPVTKQLFYNKKKFICFDKFINVVPE